MRRGASAGTRPATRRHPGGGRVRGRATAAHRRLARCRAPRCSRGSAARPTSRAHTIIENHVDDEDRLLGRCSAEWCAPGIDIADGQPVPDRRPRGHELPRWAACARRRRAPSSSLVRRRASRAGATRVRGAGHRLDRGDPGLHSTVRGGARSASTSARRGRGDGAEQQALRATARVLGAAIMRQRVGRTRREAEDALGATRGADPGGDLHRRIALGDVVQHGVRESADRAGPRVPARALHGGSPASGAA